MYLFVYIYIFHDISVNWHQAGVWGWFWFFVAIFLQFPQVLDLTNAVRTSVPKNHIYQLHIVYAPL